MYIELTKDLCLDILDVTQPPWNIPPGSSGLGGSATGNNSNCNFNRTATTAINFPLSLTSPDLLVQGTPADSISTS